MSNSEQRLKEAFDAITLPSGVREDTLTLLAQAREELGQGGDRGTVPASPAGSHLAKMTGEGDTGTVPLSPAAPVASSRLEEAGFDSDEDEDDAADDLGFVAEQGTYASAQGKANEAYQQGRETHYRRCQKNVGTKGNQ